MFIAPACVEHGGQRADHSEEVVVVDEGEREALVHAVDVADGDGVEQAHQPQQPIKRRAKGLAQAQIWGMTGAGVLPTDLILLWYLNS